MYIFKFNFNKKKVSSCLFFSILLLVFSSSTYAQCDLADDNFETCFTSFSGDVSLNDPIVSGDLEVISPPSSGTLNFNPDGSFTYDNDQSGTYCFDVETCYIISNPPPEVCQQGLIQMTVQYLGQGPVDIEAFGLNSFGVNSDVNNGDIILIENNTGNTNGQNNNWDFYVDGSFNTDIHTSCSEDILGNVYGDFLVLGFIDDNGNLNTLLECCQSTTCIEIIDCSINVGDYVWYDDDQDGIQGNELGVPNVSVLLYSPGPDGIFHTMDDVLVDSTGTDGNGYYLFEEVFIGDYCIEFLDSSLPADYIFTQQNAGMDNLVDSDVDTFGKTAPFQVMSGMMDDLSFDAGIYCDCFIDIDLGSDIFSCGLDQGIEAQSAVLIAANIADISACIDTSSLSFQWNTGATTASIVIDDAVEATYIVNVSTSEGCVGTDTLIVTLTGFELNLTDAVSVCQSETVTLNGSPLMAVGDCPLFTYLWNTGETTQTIDVTGPGTYSVLVTDCYGCQVVAQATLIENTCCQENYVDAPSGLGSLIDFVNETITLSWDEYPYATACMLFGNQSNAVNDISLLIGDPSTLGSPSEITFPLSIFNANLEYRWKLICGCSIDPLIISPFSDYDTFSISISAP